MTDFGFLHRAGATGFEEVTPSLLVWKTCRRQILFLDFDNLKKTETAPGDQLYSGLEAEVFLAEILCGLRSPLVGETEVFGQFKDWWKALPEDLPWKNLNRRRIDSIFSLVKNVREKILCGSGSQSYGSLLRRHLRKGETVDLIGAGHLVRELIPWIQSKAPYRIWCRSPHKADFASEALGVFKLTDTEASSHAVVVAAPIEHAVLNAWLVQKGMSEKHLLFDLRADSESFQPAVPPSVHLTLKDFSSKSDEFQQDVEDLVRRAGLLIQNWKEQQICKAQIRPYGWDDL